MGVYEELKEMQRKASLLDELKEFGEKKNICVILEFHPDMKTIPKFDCHLVNAKNTFAPACTGHGDSWEEAWTEALKKFEQEN